MCTTKPVDDKPTVVGVVLTYNPHVLPIFDAMARRSDIDFTTCVLEPPSGQRASLGWDVRDGEKAYIQPWRSAEERAHYYKTTQAADVVIWPGLKHPRGVQLTLKRAVKHRINILMSEPFIMLRKRSWIDTMAVRAAIRVCNRRGVHLFAVGHGADVEYRSYGGTRWKAWQYGYAVEPPSGPIADPRVAPEGVLRILFAGQLCARKGVDVFLRALGTPGLAKKAWKATLVGDGVERASLESLSRQLNLTSKVEFAGLVQAAQMEEAYRQADVLVLPSRFDGWGAVVNEAMEHGLAVIGSYAVGAAHVLIEEGTNGYIFPNEDHETLAEQLIRLVDDFELCGSMRRASLLRIPQFRPVEFAKRTAALCRGLTGHGPVPEYRDGLCRALP